MRIGYMQNNSKIVMKMATIMILVIERETGWLTGL